MTTKILSRRIETEKLHEKLRDMAVAQGVKPVEKIQDLYVETEVFDVDEFLTTIRRLRRSDSLKNHE